LISAALSLSYEGSALTLANSRMGRIAEPRVTVLFPATEHAPFDLVADAAGKFHRRQVKYLLLPYSDGA